VQVGERVVLGQDAVLAPGTWSLRHSPDPGSVVGMVEPQF
jgi:hypothetical protein